MKKTVLALILMAGSTFAQSVYSPDGSGGAPGYDPSAGAYGEPQGAYSAPPVCEPGSVWIDGYTDANGYFVNGYCTVPPFAGAYWIAPSFLGGRFVAGYWGRGGLGYAPGVVLRGGYGTDRVVRGGFSPGSHSVGGYANGFHAPAAAAPSFHSQGASRGGGSGHGGRR